MKRAFLVLVSVLLLTGGATANLNKYTEMITMQSDRNRKIGDARDDFESSIRKGDFPEAVRTAIEKSGLLARDDSFDFNMVVDTLKNDAARLPEGPQSVLYGYIASYYSQYLYSNRHTRNRTSVDFAGDDAATWPSSRFVEEIFRYYDLAVANKDALSAMSSQEYSMIFGLTGSESFKLLPTMYDILLYTIIQQTTELKMRFPEASRNSFVMNRNEYFYDARSFVNLDINSADTLSYDYKVLGYYQDLLAFRIEQLHTGSRKYDEELFSLVNLDIERLKYVRNNGIYEDSDKMYEAALNEIRNRYRADYAGEYATYELARLYSDQAAQWRTPGKEHFRNKYVEAAELCRSIVDRFPRQDISRYAAKLIKGIEAPSVSLTMERSLYPDSPILALAEHRNIERIHITVFKLSDKEGELGPEGVNLHEFTYRKPFMETTFDMPLYVDHQFYRSEMMLEGLPQGVYVIMASKGRLVKDDLRNTEIIVARTAVQVTPFTVVYRSEGAKPRNTGGYEETRQQIYLTDSRTGKPVAGARLEYWVTDYNAKRNSRGEYPEIYVGSFTSDSEGIFSLDDVKSNSDIRRIRITDKSGAQYLARGFRAWNDRYYSDGSAKSLNVVFFTDRSIYRPGQTVYYKAISMMSDGDGNNTLLPGTTHEITMYDVNGKKISSQNLMTNDFGSLHGSFEIPQGLLNGTMSIRTYGGAVYFRVEEYKRPTFEVNFDPVAGNYRLGERVEVTGSAHALAGYGIDNSEVRYRVVRNVRQRFGYYHYWMPPVSFPQKEIASGTVTTDAEGKFTISFDAFADDVRDKSLIYTYEVTADVTDLNGETRSALKRVALSDKPLLISFTLPEKIADRSDMLFPVAATNLNGDETPAKITYTISSLEAPDRILRERLWAAPDTTLISKEEFVRNFPHDIYGNEDDPSTYPVRRVIDTRIIDGLNVTVTNGKLDLRALALEPAGWYKVEMTAEDKDGNVEQSTAYVLLYGAAAGSPGRKVKPGPINNMSQWITEVKTTVEPGENAEFWVASSDEDSRVVCEVVFKGEVVEKRVLNVGTVPQQLLIPVKEEYRGGFDVQFIMVRDGRIYNKTTHINVPYTNKALNIAFTSFREKLLPGESEKWTVSIKNKEGQKEMAEMVASLYDASLDAINPHSWPGMERFYPDRRNGSVGWSVPGYGTLAYTQYSYYGEYHAPVYTMPYIYYNGTGYYNVSRAFSGSSRVLFSGNSQRMAKAAAPVEAELSMVSEMAVMEDSAVIDQMDVAQDGTGNALDEIQTRRNFNETAFFYPQLRTDKNGNIMIEFTVPEALTRWKMLGFAHTPDMKVGTVVSELITQKEVAISANAPRFFREGDTIEFTAKVNNITEGELSGTALLRLFDAATMAPLDDSMILSAGTVDFTVAAGQSTGVSWTISIPAGVQAVTYRVTAQAGSHTDGEEKIVPVLTNRMLVTESMPFYVRAGQTKEYTFDRLRNADSPTLRDYRLTLEFTSNPAWYAVQAMPYMMEYPYECAEQVFSRFYANSLSSAVVNSSPRVKQVFEMWRDQPEFKDALVSNLEKNQELKQVFLEETPWVMQAENETERKKRVGLLFDLNRMASQQRGAVNKLKQYQLSNGGFPWFAGLPANRYITQHIVVGMEHLAKLGALDGDFVSEVKQMTSSALAFVDQDLTLDYNKLKKNKEFDPGKNHIGYIQFHYLYTASFTGHKPSGKAQREAFDFYYGQAKKYWSEQNLYGQAMSALAFHRYGDTKLALEIISSLKNSAQHSDQMGMYWRDNRLGYYWYQAPVETQAMLIEAFDEVAGDTQSVEEMKIWLLRNKQTTDWRTTKATAEACYALLKTGSNLLDESRLLDVRLDDRPLADLATEEFRPEPGTGYVKTSWNGGDIEREMGKIEVSNPNDYGMGWGAMYWQYFEQLDKISFAETNIQIEKQVMLKIVTDSGVQLVTVKEGNRLKVGDHVSVRLILRADRDFEYVHLKDMRAATLEPVRTLSGHRHQDGLWYYESIKDASANFFIPYLRKGTYVFEYELRVTHAGDFSNGVGTFQCMYAPEFNSHTDGIRIRVE